MTNQRYLAVCTVIAAVAACNESGSSTAGDDVALIDASDTAGETSATDTDTGGDAGTDAGPSPDAADGGRDSGDVTPTDGGPDLEDDVDPDAVEPGPRCGDGVVDPGEACDDGDENSDGRPDACRTDCSVAACGDGVVDADEECDSGAATDVCTAICTSVFTALCADCATDGDCGDGACLPLSNGDFCGLSCDERACPDGFTCEEVILESGAIGRQCVPATGTCLPCLDPDRDEYGIGPECWGFDCDESDDAVHVGAPEVCDGVDNDCDGGVDEAGAEGTSMYYADADGDGFGDPTAAVTACGPSDAYPTERPGDCDDGDDARNPDAPDLCDGVDNDCDPDTADGDDEEQVGSACDGGDDDACPSAAWSCIDAALVCPEGPGSTLEICDGIDNDCNERTRDGSADPNLGVACDGEDTDLCAEGILTCDGSDGLVCSDRTSSTIEVCDTVDNDCDGDVDDDASDARSWYFDRDGDRFGTDASAVVACASPGRDFVERGGDCDDTTGDIAPDADEICNEVDDDCDGVADDDPIDAAILYPDGDHDGFGDESAGARFCAIPPGYIAEGEDCADENPSVNPDAEEGCADGTDNDCDGLLDCGDSSCADAVVCDVTDCSDADLGAATGRVASGPLISGTSRFTGSCVDTTAPERIFVWRAPYTGRFTIDTLGSTFDTVLYALAGGCEGEELDCADDSFGGPERTRSQIQLDLAEGERVLIVLDAYAAGGAGGIGSYVLNIEGDVVEICDDAVDNDSDELVDCGDDDCTFDEACCPADVFEPNEGVEGSPSTTWDAYNAQRDAALTVRSGNIDSFRLPACNGAAVRAVARFSHSSGDIDLRLLRQNGSVLATSTSSDDDELIEIDIIENLDRLFLQAYVAGSEAVCVGYTIDIEVDTRGCAD